MTGTVNPATTAIKCECYYFCEIFVNKESPKQLLTRFSSLKCQTVIDTMFSPCFPVSLTGYEFFVPVNFAHAPVDMRLYSCLYILNIVFGVYKAHARSISYGFDRFYLFPCFQKKNGFFDKRQESGRNEESTLITSSSKPFCPLSRYRPELRMDSAIEKIRPVDGQRLPSAYPAAFAAWLKKDWLPSTFTDLPAESTGYIIKFGQ